MSLGDLWSQDGPQEPPPPINLYDWQGEAVEECRVHIRAGRRNILLVAPTGSGKTVMGSYLVRGCYEKGQRAAFLADRVPLISQTSATFDQYGIPHGVMQGDHWRNRPEERIQVASAQTVKSRGWPEDLDLIIVDEAHTLYSVVTNRIAKRSCVTIGLTATPFTRGLGKYYDAVVTVRTTYQLIAEGRLAPFVVYAPSEPDMTGAKTTAGEWTDREAERRSLPIVGDLVTEYLRHADGKKFIAFGATIKHCEEIQRQMMAAGVMCGLYTSKTPDSQREAMIRELREPNGYLRGLVSVAALAKGFDNPAIECVIIARPLRSSFSEHIQILGRGLRVDPNNPEKKCLVLDHAGNCTRFWSRMEEFFEHGATELDNGEKKEQAKPEAKEREPYKCPQCSNVHAPRPMCPSCGHEYPRRSEIEHVPGELSQLTGQPVGTREDKQAIYSQLLYVARDRGYKEGWARKSYQERFGSWPDGLQEEEAPPSRATLNWVRSRLIAYARGRQKGAAA